MTTTKVRRSGLVMFAAPRGRDSEMNPSASGKRSLVRKRSRSSITTGRQPRAAAKRTTGMASVPAPQMSSLGDGSSTSTKAVMTPPPTSRSCLIDNPFARAAPAAAAAASSTSAFPRLFSRCPSGCTTSRAPRSTPSADHGDDRPLALLFARPPESAGHLERLLRRLDEQLHGAVAPETPAPDRLVVGGEVEIDQAGLAPAHDLPGKLLHVAVDATAADVADELPVTADEETGTGAAVGRAPDRNDGGERHLLPALGEGLDGFENVRDLAAHRRMLKP